MSSISNSSSAEHCRRGEELYLQTLGHIQTLREKILHQCLEKFYETPTAVESYCQNHKQRFITAGTERAGAALAEGLVDYKAFKELQYRSDVHQILRDSGLTREEIELLLKDDVQNYSLDSTGDFNEGASCSFNLPEDIEARNVLRSLKSVHTKLSQRDAVLNTLCVNESFRGAAVLSRRQYEEQVRYGILERENYGSTASQNSASDVLQDGGGSARYVKIQPKTQPAVHPDHPLNHLAALELQLFPNLERKRKLVDEEHESLLLRTTKQFKKGENIEEKFAKIKIQNTVNEDFNSTNVNDKTTYVILNEATQPKAAVKLNASKSLWDVREDIALVDKPILESQGSTADKKPTNDVSYNQSLPCRNLCGRTLSRKDYSMGYVSTPDLSTQIPITEIKENCITKTRLLESFPNHCIAEPSRTLFVKNLCFQLKPQELVDVFGHFDDKARRAVYRLLIGKMRGQAFIRFADIESSARALDTCQGYILKGKPVIIAFSKKNRKHESETSENIPMEES